MTKMLIRVDAEVTDELMSAFPQLRSTPHPAQTTLSGELADQAELQGLLSYLSSMGITVVEVVTVPD